MWYPIYLYINGIYPLVEACATQPTARSSALALQELQQYLAEVHADSDAARGRSLQVPRLPWQKTLGSATSWMGSVEMFLVLRCAMMCWNYFLTWIDHLDMSNHHFVDLQFHENMLKPSCRLTHLLDPIEDSGSHTLRYSNMACWKMNHLSVIFLIKHPFSWGIFPPAMWSAKHLRVNARCWSFSARWMSTCCSGGSWKRSWPGAGSWTMVVFGWFLVGESYHKPSRMVNVCNVYIYIYAYYMYNIHV